MRLLRRYTLLASIALSALLAPAAAHAATFDALGFHLSSPLYIVHEHDGSAAITISRTNVIPEAQIRYVALGIGVPCGGPMCTAVSPYDFTPVKGMIDFPAGVGSETFTIPIVDHGIFGLPKTLQISLFGPSPIGMGIPSTAVLTILNDDPPVAHDPLNPLALPSAPPPSNPLAGAQFFVDHESVVAHEAQQYPGLNVIASQPGTARFGKFSWPDAGVGVQRYLARAAAQQPGTVPMLATYRIAHGHCGHWSDPPSEQAAYHNFIQRFAQGIGDYRAVLFLEMDSLITTPCLTPHGLAVRMQELRDAISILTANCPRLVIYLDAGAADAVPARQIADLLVRAGIGQIQGFFLNSTHFDWTSKEIRFGEQISRLTGGKHFVVNTGEAGQGPLIPRNRVKDGNEVLCNPPGRGLGPRPSTDTGYPNVDAFAWTSNPGESGGACVPGAPPTASYWPAYGLMLVRNGNFNVT
jgi:endoglucanase